MSMELNETTTYTIKLGYRNMQNIIGGEDKKLFKKFWKIKTCQQQMFLHKTVFKSSAYQR